MNRANFVLGCWRLAGLAALSAAPQNAADVRHLTLTEAVHLAISQNRALKIARLKVTENEQKKAGERSSYFPTITNQSNVLHVTESAEYRHSGRGAWGCGGSLVPAQNVGYPAGPEHVLLQRHAGLAAAHAVDPDP